MPSATRLAAPEGPGPVPGVRLLTLPTSAIRAHGVALSAAAVLALCALGRAGAGETADVLLRGQWPPPH